MRVGILCIQHESNTFIPQPTELTAFEADRLLVGERVREQAAAHHEVGGFFEGLAAQGIEAVPLLMAVTLPHGIVTDHALAALLEIAWEQLDRAGELDGLLVAPHGAAVSATHRDMDGHWLSALRRRVGEAMPIVCTLDLHANVSRAMVEACDATIAYRSNPHTDMRATGVRAAQLMGRILRGEVKPTQALAAPPIAINIERQTTAQPPCRELFALADAMLQRPGVLSNSVLLGFAYADVAEMGASFIVVTDDDPALAQRCADELAAYVEQRREDFVADLIGPDEALDRAAQLAGPVLLLDMGDNVGGGGPGDATVLAHAIHRRPGLRGFVALADADAARRAIAAGVGAKVRLAMGGRSGPLHGEPLEAEVTVVTTHDGTFRETSPRHGGRMHFDMGPTAVVRTDGGLTVQLTSRRVMPSSLGQLTCCGLDPAAFDVITAKGVVAPLAAYDPVCPNHLRVNTPGVTTADMLSLPYEHRRRPLFPFER